MYQPIQSNNRRNSYQQDNNNSDAFPLLMGVQTQGKDPRQENFWDFMHLTCCPTFTMASFIFFISILDILLYIISLVNSDKIQGEFLAPDIQSLKELGALYPFALKNGAVWLLITAFLLHAHFLHIIFNVFAQFLFGMGVETIVGTLRLASLYCASGIGGNIFSALVSDNISVGASTCIFGLLGAQLVLIIINWDYLERYGTFRCQMLLLIIFIILLNFLFGMSQGEESHVNNFGHFGGFFTGFFLAFIIFKPIQQNQPATTWKHVSIALLIIYFVLCFGIFYIFRHPEPLFGENGHQPKTEKSDQSKSSGKENKDDKKFF